VVNLVEGGAAMDDDCGVRRLKPALKVYGFPRGYLTAIETQMHMRKERERKGIEALDGMQTGRVGKKM